MSKDEKKTGEALDQAFFRDRDVAREGAGLRESILTISRWLGKYALTMLVLLALLDLGLRTFLPPQSLMLYMEKETAFNTLKVKQYLTKPAPDVVFIGSSRLRQGLNPERFAEDLSKGLGRKATAYNLGIDGAMVEEYYALVASHMQDPAPKWIVLGLSGMEVTQIFNFQYAPRFLWRFPDFLHYLKRTPFNEIDISTVEYYIESILSRGWYLFDQRDALSALIAEKVGVALGLEKYEKEAEFRRTHKKKRFDFIVKPEWGYSPDPDEPPSLTEQVKNKTRKVPKANKERLALDAALFEKESNVEFLRMIVEKAEELGSRVALVEFPPSVMDQKSRSRLGGEGFRRWMKEVSDDIGVLFIPFPPEKTGLDDTHYRDYSHLNNKGAQRYTRLLFKRLWDAGFFKEDRP